MRLFTCRLCLILLCSLCLASSSLAAETSHRQAVEEMLRLTKADQMMDPLYQQMEGMLETQFEQMNIAEAHRPVLKKYTQQMFQLLRTEMSWEVLKDDFIDLYLKVYSEREIEALNDFYRSEAGRKMIETMPLLMRESLTLTQQNMRRLMPRLQQIS
ncbi:MAG: DUF2059 domain-containing protein, partial [Syntrophotaleaceae bacterium]